MCANSALPYRALKFRQMPNNLIAHFGGVEYISRAMNAWLHLQMTDAGTAHTIPDVEL